MSDTNPLPAQALLALADAMANAVGSHVICDAGLEGSHMERTLEAYRAARAASPVTLEEHLLIRVVDEFQSEYDDFGMPAKAGEDLFKHARRLAGEGGA